MTFPSTNWSLFYDQLHRFVATRVSASADVDDLVQVILERAIAKSRDTEVESSVGWLFGIARNAVTDHYRARGRSLAHAIEELEDVVSSTQDSAEERAAVIACMEPLLDSIPTESARLLRWADMHGRSMQSIGDELGISLTAAKSRVQRARKEFFDATRACCAITVDARSRVTDLTPRRGCATGCSSCAPENERRQ
jgi:RNA polymerase sigma-70 factor (ECF subfamily)